jgi:hypothetical protein
MKGACLTGVVFGFVALSAIGCRQIVGYDYDEPFLDEGPSSNRDSSADAPMGNRAVRGVADAQSQEQSDASGGGVTNDGGNSSSTASDAGVSDATRPSSKRLTAASAP